MLIENHSNFMLRYETFCKRIEKMFVQIATVSHKAQESSEGAGASTSAMNKPAQLAPPMFLELIQRPSRDP